MLNEEKDTACLQEFIHYKRYTLLSDDTVASHYRWQSGRFRSHARAFCAYVYVGTRRLTDAAYLHCVAVQLSLVSGIKRRKFRAD